MKATKIPALLAILAVSVSAMAQTFEEKVSDMSLLMDKSVQTELGITEATRTKLNKHADDFNQKANKLQQDFQKSGKSDPPVAELAKYEAELKKKVMGELSAAQKKRLSEITLQVAGYTALLDQTVADKVGLSKAQLDKLRKAFESNATEARRVQEAAMKKISDKYKDKQPQSEEEAKELQKKIQPEIDAAQKELQPKLKALREEFITAVKKTVKAIQLNKFEALQGKPFKGLKNG